MLVRETDDVSVSFLLLPTAYFPVRQPDASISRLGIVGNTSRPIFIAGRVPIELFSKYVTRLS